MRICGFTKGCSSESYLRVLPPSRNRIALHRTRTRSPDTKRCRLNNDGSRKTSACCAADEGSADAKMEANGDYSIATAAPNAADQAANAAGARPKTAEPCNGRQNEIAPPFTRTSPKAISMNAPVIDLHSASSDLANLL